MAGHIAAFVAANHPAATPQSARHAVEQLLHVSRRHGWAGRGSRLPLLLHCCHSSCCSRALLGSRPYIPPPPATLQATAASFELLSPYCEAAGRGSPAALLAAQGPPPTPNPDAYCFGSERQPQTAGDRGSHAHPGELAAAEAFARAAQRRMLAAGLPAGVDAGGVRVAVTVHLQLDTFIYSQPTVFQAETPAGGRCRGTPLLLGLPTPTQVQRWVGADMLRPSPAHPPLSHPTFAVQAPSGWSTATCTCTGSTTR